VSKKKRKDKSNSLRRLSDMQDCGDGDDDIHVLALVRGQQHFIWLYTAENREAVRQSIGRFASNPDLTEFDWYHAALLSQKLRDEEGEAGK